MTSVSTTSILVLCSANQCRSPMAEGLLTRHLSESPTRVVVRSAGLFSEGEPASPEAISALAAHGLDLSGHRSHRVAGSDLAWADLVLGMSREHVRHAVVTAPDTWPRAFTLKELVRRGEESGPRQPAEPFASWLARVHEGRTQMALLGDSPADDVADPMGGPPQAYADTVVLLDDLLGRVAALGWGLPAGRLPR